MKTILFGLSVLGITSCLFSGNDLREAPLLRNYYISFNGRHYCVIMKEKYAGTEALIISGVDSIGLHGGLIAGFAQSRYFLLNAEVGSEAEYFVDHEGFNSAIQKDQNGKLVLQEPGVFFVP